MEKDEVSKDFLCFWSFLQTLSTAFNGCTAPYGSYQVFNMSVLIETSAGDIVIDLLVDYVPKMCENFLKLCKVKYYNFSPIHSVQKNFSFQTGDPLGPMSPQSDGGSSIWGLISGDPADKTFPALFHPKLKHLERGTVSMATVPHPTDPDERLAGSQFIVTLGDKTDYLDGKAAIFGKVVEGFDVLEKINDAIVDDRGHPLVDIRIKHTVVLDDPYPDPPGLREPSSSPPPTKAQLATVRIAEDEQLLDPEADEQAAAEAERKRREREAAAQALTLEMMGDLPFAEVKPPENVLFVCQLNPVTTDEDLELIFSRFGKILSCEVIRDKKTGDSLQYAFIEFEEQRSCEEAYSKMDNVLIDDRRIHVDFCQSVSRLSEAWRKETNEKRRAAAARKRGGGWGGVQELEKRRQYRNEHVEHTDDHKYQMVHGMEDLHSRHSRDTRRAPGETAPVALITTVLEMKTAGKIAGTTARKEAVGVGIVIGIVIGTAATDEIVIETGQKIAGEAAIGSVTAIGIGTGTKAWTGAGDAYQALLVIFEHQTPFFSPHPIDFETARAALGLRLVYVPHRDVSTALPETLSSAAISIGPYRFLPTPAEKISCKHHTSTHPAESAGVLMSVAVLAFPSLLTQLGRHAVSLRLLPRGLRVPRRIHKAASLATCASTSNPSSASVYMSQNTAKMHAPAGGHVQKENGKPLEKPNDDFQ
ncbi:hypothetical protein VTJ04DRAFT_8389 [Mycothermus thermophilus]|uniref:uncharacterized protein n=1 Tax=Humicola insolens TaxID=85995 RepID=UPI0037435281